MHLIVQSILTTTHSMKIMNFCIVSLQATPGAVVCMCMTEPKLVELFYDMMGIEQQLNESTGYAKMCGTCKMKLEGPVGMAPFMKESIMAEMEKKKGKKGGMKGMDIRMSPMMKMLMEDSDEAVELESMFD